MSTQKNMKLAKIGKYKGCPYMEIPQDYASWQYINGDKSFFYEWQAEQKFRPHTKFIYGELDCGRMMERKLSDGTYVFQIQIKNRSTIYYLVSSEGEYIRDLYTFGSMAAKQGAIDTTCTDYVTLTPSGQKLNGKMIISPYYEHFEYLTYQEIKSELAK